jgi:hypothetical protein
VTRELRAHKAGVTTLTRYHYASPSAGAALLQRIEMSRHDATGKALGGTLVTTFASPRFTNSKGGA